MKQLRIAIVGYGTAGQAAAVLLARDGHDVSVFERVPTPGPVGAGFLLQRRACELLETTSLPVEKISELAGFQTPVSLREHFRKRHRVSPREWRRTFGHA